MEKPLEQNSWLHNFLHDNQEEFKAIWSEADSVKAESLRKTLHEAFIKTRESPYKNVQFSMIESVAKTRFLTMPGAVNTRQVYTEQLMATADQFDRKIAAIPREVESHLKGAAAMVFGAALIGSFVYRYVKEQRKTSQGPWTERFQSERALPYGRER